MLFAPRESDLYPQPQTFKVHPDPRWPTSWKGTSPRLLHRRVHRGDEAVCLRVRATAGGTAVFGKKDYQQLMVIRRMVQQFALPITIVAGDTARRPMAWP